MPTQLRHIGQEGRGTSRYGAERVYRDYVARRRVWHFGLSPAGVAPLLAEYGWTEREQLGPAEYRTSRRDRWLESVNPNAAVSGRQHGRSR